MYFLIFLLLLILFIAVFAIMSAWGILRSLFNFGRKPKPRSKSASKPSQPKREKFFQKNDGEYIDYEEVEEEEEEEKEE